MFGLTDCGKWNQGELGAGNVLVLLNLHDKVAIGKKPWNQWKTKARFQRRSADFLKKLIWKTGMLCDSSFSIEVESLFNSYLWFAHRVKT